MLPIFFCHEPPTHNITIYVSVRAAYAQVARRTSLGFMTFNLGFSMQRSFMMGLDTQARRRWNFLCPRDIVAKAQVGVLSCNRCRCLLMPYFCLAHRRLKPLAPVGCPRLAWRPNVPQ